MPAPNTCPSADTVVPKPVSRLCGQSIQPSFLLPTVGPEHTVLLGTQLSHLYSSEFQASQDYAETLLQKQNNDNDNTTTTKRCTFHSVVRALSIGILIGWVW